MDARFYNSEEINIEQLANDLENIYRAQGYQVQQIATKDQIMVQLKKGGDFETLIGMGVALSVIIQRTAGGVLGMIGQQKWMDKAAAGAVGAVGLVIPVLLPLAVTAGVGALRQMSLANQVLNVVDGLVRQQRPGIQGGPIPVQLMPQLQQQWAPPRYSPPPQVYTPPVQYIPPPQPQPQPQTVLSQPAVAPAPAPAKLRCPNCNTPYEEGDTFCTGCGKTLKTLCPNCKAELKPDASFCPKCGASVFQTFSATQAAMPAPAAQQKQPETQAAPPAQQKQPETPYYVPPTQAVPPPAPKPQTPPRPIVAKPSSEPAYDPKAAWGSLTFNDGKQVTLAGERAVVGRYDHDLGGINLEVDLGSMQGAETVSRVHAALEHVGSSYTLTDLNSTNATRINGKRLEPDKPTPINDGDTLQFGKVTCTFKKA